MPTRQSYLLATTRKAAMAEAESTTRPVLNRSFAGTTGSLTESRHAVAESIADRDFDQDVVDKAVLAVNEMTTNAVEASPGADYQVVVAVDGDDLILKVRNRAPSTEIPDSDDWGPNGILAGRGRGLAIVGAIAESVEVVEGADWVEVTARLSAA